MSDEAQQWELITPESHPERLDVLDYIANRPKSTVPTRYRHTGRRFFRRIQQCPALAEMVITGLRMGMSIRLLSLRIGVAPKTLAAARRLLTERGELPPVRRRVDRLLDEFVEEGLEYALEGIRSGKTHPGQIPIPALAGFDKMSQRDAGIVVGTDRTQEETALARLEAAAQALGLVQGGDEVPTDLASVGHVRICGDFVGSEVLDTAPDTASERPEPVLERAALPATTSAAEPAGARVAPEGGEGVGDRRPARTPMGLPDENLA